MNNEILVVDDDEDFLITIKKFLTEYNPQWSVEIANSPAKAEELILKNSYDTILLDIKMEGEDGVCLLEKFKKNFPTIPIIMVSGQSSIKVAIDCIHKGAMDYIEKPFDKNRLVISITKALNLKQVLEDYQEYKDSLIKVSEFIGESEIIKRIKILINKIAPTDIPVLITGESGTGKEIVARTIHKLSKRSNNNFLAFNCATIPDTLIDSELFGYEKGAFSGANTGKVGFIESVNNGTLFLDEISEMKLETQAKLLRAVENQEIHRLGNPKEIKINVRFIAATNKNLIDYIKEGRFREDLYHRLKGFEVKLPPLRHRREDIPLLIKYFADNYTKHSNRNNISFTETAYKYLQGLDWNGNVRELKNFIESLISLNDKEKIELVDTLKFISLNKQNHNTFLGASVSYYKQLIKDIEREIFIATLEKNNMNIKKTAEELGIDRSNFYRKLKEYKII